MSAPVILLLPNAGPGVGGGHVLRCLSLARALGARGARPVFAVSPEGASLLDRFGDGLFDCLPIENFDVDRVAPAAVVFDNYGWGAEAEAPFATSGRGLMAIDDLADRAHAVDLLLDPGYGRAAEAYSGKVPPEARLLLGPEYALLRPEFAAGRAAAFAPVRERVERVFVCFGLSDVEAIAERAVALVRRAAPEVAIDVALSSDAPSLGALQARAAADARLSVHVNAPDVAGLIASADLCVGAGGVATWERACLGAPTVAVAVAENQRALIEALESAGVLFGCDLYDSDFETCFDAALDTLLRATWLRCGMREEARALCDGRGAERAANALLSALREKR